MVFPDKTKAVHVDQDVLVEESAVQWLLTAVQLSYSLQKPLSPLASMIPMQLKCVNFMWTHITERCLGLD